MLERDLYKEEMEEKMSLKEAEVMMGKMNYYAPWLRGEKVIT